MPAVEVVVAASVAVLGLLILTATHNGRLWLPVLAAAFGAVQGHAHGTELPAGAAPVAYITGFVVTTAALHLAGYSVGTRFAAGGLTPGQLVQGPTPVMRSTA